MSFDFASTVLDEGGGGEEGRSYTTKKHLCLFAAHCHFQEAFVMPCYFEYNSYNCIIHHSYVPGSTRAAVMWNFHGSRAFLDHPSCTTTRTVLPTMAPSTTLASHNTRAHRGN